MYEIKILNSKDFDLVSKSDPRYKFVDDSNMGFADRQKNVAYVRQTHIHDLNKYLVTHELEELEKDESLHQDAYGIRHKKGPKLFKDIILPTITGGLMGGGQGAMEGFTQGAQGYQNRVAQNSGQQSSGSYAPSETSGSYSPLNSFNIGNLFGSSTLPQSFSGSYSPSITMGGINSGTINGNQMNQQPQISNEVLEKLRGNYVGAIKF